MAGRVANGIHAQLTGKKMIDMPFPFDFYTLISTNLLHAHIEVKIQIIENFLKLKNYN